MNRARSLFFLILSVATSFGSPIYAYGAPQVAPESFGIRIAQIPAAVSENPFASSYIVSRLRPGIALTQRLEVFSTSSQEITVSVYPGLATYKNDKFLVGNGREGNKLTSWTKLSSGVLLLKPGETKWFDMTISPPQDAPSDQQFGVIWAEVQAAPTASGINAVNRVGLRMYIPVGNAPDISIVSTGMTAGEVESFDKKTFFSHYILELILVFVILFLLFLILFLLMRRRDKSDKKSQKENEKRLEAQWKRERDRRRVIWKNRRETPENLPYDDEYDDRR